MKPIQYVNENDGIFVTVQPHQDYGMATIWDADILIWAASVLCDMKNRGTNDVPRELKFQPYDLLRAISRPTGGKDYAQLRDSLERLKTTVVTTNIRVKRSQKNTMFSWIDGWEDLIDSQTKESRGLTITVSDWFYRGVMEDGGLLSIDPAYFSITGGRERWLYRVARKHAGGNGANGFAISMPVLFEKSGAEGTYRRFKFEMLRVVQRNDLPGFFLSVRESSTGEPLIHMVKSEHAGEGAFQNFQPQPKKEARPTQIQAEEADFLFPSLKAEGKVPLSPSVFVADHLRPAAKAAGVAIADGQRFGLHNLRHSLSSWLVNKAKVEPKTVQSILRHSRIQTTLDLYTQGDGEATQAAQGAFLKELAQLDFYFGAEFLRQAGAPDVFANAFGAEKGATILAEIQAEHDKGVTGPALKAKADEIVAKKGAVPGETRSLVGDVATGASGPAVTAAVG